MGMRRVLRAMPTLLRVGVAETVAYRAEFLVWVLTTTQPLIMLSLMTFVTRSQPFHGYTQPQIVAYYLANLIVRQLTSNWVAWHIMDEIRLGTMSMRLLRPLHPFWAYMAAHLAAIPFRVVVALPLATILLVSSGATTLPHAWYQLALLPVTIGLGWLLTFSIFYAIGSLAFFMTQTMAIANAYFSLFSLFSGYMLPLEMLPRPIQVIADWLPFKYLMYVPLQIMTRELPASECLYLVGGQLVWLAIALVCALFMWNRGIRRFESVGT